MKTILIATDFSPAATNAAEYALELAKYFDSKLILLNTYPLPVANSDIGLPPDILTELHNASAQNLSELKNHLLQKVGEGLDIQYFSAMGDTIDAIAEHCKNEKVDLVVMGIIGKAGKIKEHLIGSNAITAGRELDVPVLIVPEQVRYKRIHKLSFACDMDHTEESNVVYTAKYFTKLFDAELEIISVEEPNAERTINKAASIEFVEENLSNTSHKTFLLSDEDAVLGLEEHYTIYPADIIMLSPKKHSLFGKLFHKSVAKKLAFHSSVPLLMIH